MPHMQLMHRVKITEYPLKRFGRMLLLWIAFWASETQHETDFART